MKKILLALIILIFLLFSSYSISNYLFDKKYNKASVLSNDIDELKEQFKGNNTIYEQLQDIEDTVKFINKACLGTD